MESPLLVTVYKTADADADAEFGADREQLDLIVRQLCSNDIKCLEHGDVETWLHAGGMEFLRRLMQGYLNLGSRYEPALTEVVGAEG